jgi:hypothetical protein
MLQLTAGNMYQATGLIIAGLMTGLAVGAGIIIPFINNKTSLKVGLLILFYIIIGLSSGIILKINSRIIVIGLLVISGFFPAVITGNFFRELTSAGNLSSNSSRVYSADLAGSALGFIIFSGLVIPLLGISISIFLLPVLIIAGFLFAAIGK